MKTSYLIGSPGGAGAVATHFAALGAELARRGQQVKLLCGPDQTQTADGPEVLTWPSPRPTGISDAIFLAKTIRRHRPQCIVANFAAVNWMCIIGWLSRVQNRIAFYHTLSTQLENDFAKSARQNTFSRQRKRLVYHTATGIAAFSQAALDDIQKAYSVPPAKCALWRYSMADPKPALSAVPPSRRENKIICVGRLHPSKGQDVLLAALSLCGNLARSTRIEFVGGGWMEDQLRKSAAASGLADRCTFSGNVSRNDVLQKMASARIAVVPSRHEAFGIVNVESMSVGTPVVASNIDGIPEIVRDGVDGFLVPPGDPAALADKLSLLLSNPALCDRLGQNARQRFLTQYENSAAVGAQADRLQNLLREPRLKVQTSNT